MEKTLQWIDTHTHLSSPDFDADRAEVLKRALQNCEFLVEIGAGTAENAPDRAKALSESHEAIYFSAGVHPHDAEKVESEKSLRESFLHYYSHPKCVAVGECGLDYFYDNSPREKQKEVFRWQIKIAEEVKLPLSIHTRDANEDTIELLKDYEGQAVFHCFTGSQELADFGVQKNFFISFSGIVTFKKAEDLRERLKSVPLENLLIETDAPYLAPIPHRGKRNESSFIEHTASFVAEQKNISVEKLQIQLRENSKRLFKFSS